jgi:hypothetical protein
MLSMHAAGDVRPGRRRAVPRRFRHVRAASTSSAAYLQLTARAGHNPQVCRGRRALAHRRVQTRETEVTAGRAELQTRPRGAIRRLARLTDLVVGRAQCGPYLPTQEVPAPEMQSAFVVPQTPAQPPNRAPTHGTLRNISRTRRSEHACRPIRRFLDRSEHRIVRQHSIPHHASGGSVAVRRRDRQRTKPARSLPGGCVRLGCCIRPRRTVGPQGTRWHSPLLLSGATRLPLFSSTRRERFAGRTTAETLVGDIVSRRRPGVAAVTDRSRGHPEFGMPAD